MAYVDGNPSTKKMLKEMVEKGSAFAFQPGLGKLPEGGGDLSVEGPHYPQPHKWYARVRVDADGKIVKVLS